MNESLIKQLRSDDYTGDGANLRREAADELERMYSYVERVEAWHRQGQELLAAGDFGAMFKLGALWASLPIKIK